MRIESSSCLHSYPVDLALCLVQTLSCSTLPSWVIDGPVQKLLDNMKLKNQIVNHLHVSFTIIRFLKWFKMYGNKSFPICFQTQTVNFRDRRKRKTEKEFLSFNIWMWRWEGPYSNVFREQVTGEGPSFITLSHLLPTAAGRDLMGSRNIITALMHTLKLSTYNWIHSAFQDINGFWGTI